jgi:RimJ/RimL family protein N-acetyltransferase
LIGFRSFGADGQVPGGKYDPAALDTGGGLRPELVGQGVGYEAIRTGLEHGRQLFHPAGFRVTIAAFNIRALRVVDRLGFSRVAGFEATTDGRPYDILIRSERNPRAT